MLTNGWTELDVDAGKAAIIRALDNERLVIVAGAGISQAPPAECPTWEKLVYDIAKAGAAAHPQIEGLSQRVLAKWEPRSIKTEAVCQLLHANLGSSILDAFNILVHGRPNGDHIAMARLAGEGKVRAIITTNFDVYIEEALHHRGVAYEPFIGDPPRKLARSLASSGGGSPMILMKPHGSIGEVAKLLMTMRQVGRPATRPLHGAIAAALRTWPVLLVGYSARDDDIFPLLIGEAPTAKRVFWALWNEDEPNVRAFAKRSPRFTLIRCRKQSLLQRLAGTVDPSPRPKVDREAGALQIWTASHPESAWTNFFCELLLMLEPTVAAAEMVSRYSEEVLAQPDSRLATLKAQRNRAVALLVRGDSATGRQAVESVLQSYLAAGRPREFIEVIATAAEYIPLNTGGQGRDYLYQAALYSGNSFEPHLLGQAMLASAIDFAKSGKLIAARSYLLAAAGFLLRSGDTATFHKCLLRMAEVADRLQESDLSRLCRRQAEVLAATGSVVDDDEPTGRSSLLDLCESAAWRWMRRTILGEAMICSVLSAGAALVVALLTSNLPSFFPWFGFGIGGCALGKLFGALKSRRYPSIERT